MNTTYDKKIIILKKSATSGAKHRNYVDLESIASRFSVQIRVESDMWNDK